ncbi:MAG: hypothetical protein HYY97_15830 [Rhodocyclales bacterium]|nr:hypothetical protein [Rhodocyclales bacterium]
MLAKQPKATFKADVEISIAGGGVEIIKVEYRYFTRKQMAAWAADLSKKTPLECLTEVMVGWSDYEEAYSPAALEEMLDNYPTSERELFNVFRRELLESKAKN